MGLSQLKHLQCYMNTFEIYYRKFQRLSQTHQLSTTFHFTIEEVFETLDTANIEISTTNSIVDPILNRNFGNTFHHQNGINQCQQFHKNISQHYQ